MGEPDEERVPALGWRVRTALADTWQAEGRIRAGAVELPGVRLMASGVAHPQWNSGDVTGDDVDLDAVRAWYRDRGVPWGLRVPPEVDLRFGHHVMTQPCLGLVPGAWRSPPPAAGVVVELLDAGDPLAVAAYLATAATAFGDPPELLEAWMAPAFGQAGWHHLVARVDGEVAGVGYTTRTSGAAGEAAALWGLGTLPRFRRRGVATAVLTRAVEGAFASGADLLVLNPEGESRPLYERTGFVGVGGVDIYVDRPAGPAGTMAG